MSETISLVAISHYAPLSDRLLRQRMWLMGGIAALFLFLALGVACAGGLDTAFWLSLPGIAAAIALIILGYDYRLLRPEEAAQFGAICASHGELALLVAPLALRGYTPRWRDWDVVRRFAKDPVHNRDEARRQAAVASVRAALALKKLLGRGLAPAESPDATHPDGAAHQ